MKINKSNYSKYKAISNIFWDVLEVHFPTEMDPDDSPRNVLERWEKEDMNIAIRSLREGLRDQIIWLSDWPDSLKKELEQQFKQNNLPSLKTLIAQVKDLPKKVIKKGQIKNLDEYYIIKEVLDDLESGLTNEDRETLNTIFSAFEQEYIQKKKDT